MSTFAKRLPPILHQDTIYLCERSIHSSFHVFGKLLDLPKEEQFMLEQIYNGYVEGSSVKGIIYIQSSVKDCFRKARLRNFSSDKLLTEEYLTKVEIMYMDWLKKTHIPVFHIKDSEIGNTPIKEVLTEAFDVFDMLI